MDIRPPQRRVYQERPQSDSGPVAAQPDVTPAPVEVPAVTLDALPPQQPKKSLGKKILIGIGALFLVIIAGCGAAYYSYQQQLQPVDASNKTIVRIAIDSGSTPAQIASKLYDNKLIHSTRVFDIYTRFSGTRGSLRAGSYSLSQSQSLPDIVGHLVSGKAEQFKVTFYTGGTLESAPDTPDKKKTDVTTMLLRAGYSQEQITAALAATYDLPLFAGKPTGASLEGYVYGDTYVIDSSTTAQQLLKLAFTTFNDAVVNADIANGLRAQGLSLYDGIVLASIVQAEMGAHEADMPQVAQVFLKRLSVGMPLGSDVTAYYGANKIGVSPTVAVDTPYNTRIHAGLPPGPIGAPSLAALKAVANPASGDYLFFLSGDDGTTHFAATDAQHEANKVYCKTLCAIP